MIHNQEIKAIVLDLGNVLIDFDHMIASQRLSHFCSASQKEIYDLFFDSPLTCLFEEGKISPQDFFLEVKKILALKLDYSEFLPIWNEIFFLTPKNEAVYRLAKDLKNRYTLCLASNINILHFEYLKENFSIFDVFHKFFLSYEVGLRKPAPLFYQTILKELSLPKEAFFYTDDRQELIEAAQNLGIKSVVFQGIEKLKEELSCAGVTWN
ncbi:MAG: HAD-IA family hydrolase [Candidatus Omnitrophica bacterium]|nr:HAD-IA family hydrolase [Candidatus Omnitrophota bacterium]